MSDQENLTRHAPLSPSAVAGRLVLIGGVLFASALAFAYAGGWLTHRLTPARMIAGNHSKGICFTGVFDANGAGSAKPRPGRPVGRTKLITASTLSALSTLVALAISCAGRWNRWFHRHLSSMRH